MNKMNKLPTYKGYTVDIRLKEFRKADIKKGLEFIPFDSDRGDKLLNGYLKTLSKKHLLEVENKVI
jgi:hypothetical protein